MDDLIGEGLFYIFGPIIAVFAIIALIGYGFTETYQWITGTEPIVEEYQAPVVEQKSLSHKAGHKAKEVSKDFIKGFFSK